MGAQVAAVDEIGVSGEKLEGEFGCRLPKVSFAKAQGRHVRAV